MGFSAIPSWGGIFANAILWTGPKKQVTVRVDPDVGTFFPKQVRGYGTPTIRTI